MSTFARRTILGCLVPVLLACGDAPTEPTVASVRLQALTSATTKTIIVEISGPDISPSVIVNIPVGADAVARDSLRIPAGSSRQLSLTAVDSAGVQTYRADTTITLRAGVNPSITIQLKPLQGSLAVAVGFTGARMAFDTAARSMLAGDSLVLSATATSAIGASVPSSALVWGSSNPAIATVVGGVVRAVRPGVARIGVSYQGASASVPLTVSPSTFPQIGLLAFLSFDGNTADSSGAGNHFTNSGGTFITDRNGKAKSAISFAGNASKAMLNWASFPKDEFTVSFWFRNQSAFSYSSYAYFLWGTAPGTTSPSVNVSIDQNAVRCSTPGDGYALGWTVGATGALLVDSTAAGGCLATSVITTWRHVAITVSAGVARVYLNGALWHVRNIAAWNPTTTVANLGPLHNLTAGSGAARELDSFAVWSRALTEAEVRQVYASTR